MIALVLFLLLLAVPARAQQPGPQPLDAPLDHIEFLSRYDFQLEVNLLTGDNPDLFRWDSHFGGAFDLVNYGKGRLTMVGDYEAVMGSELRPFDPNQGNYILEPSMSWFFGKDEVAFVFHHVSRHLSDRPKRYAIAYNIAEARYLRKFRFDRTTVAVRASAGHLTQRGDVDYTWTGEWDVTVVHPLNSYVHGYARTTGEMFGTDPAVRGRSEVEHTARLEAGVRLIGGRADLELFAGLEHRLDALQTDYFRPGVTWGLAGFRVASK